MERVLLSSWRNLLSKQRFGSACCFCVQENCGITTYYDHNEASGHILWLGRGGGVGDTFQVITIFLVSAVAADDDPFNHLISTVIVLSFIAFLWAIPDIYVP